MGISRTDALLLGVAVAATSTSAPLTREAAAPALAIAFWRNAFSSAGLVPLAAGRHRAGLLPRRAQLLSVAAGAVLAAHFATWISSLSLTTVASSVALVCTQPIWAALIAGARGEPIGRNGWIGIAIALAGVVLATGIDVGGSGRALTGDVLALVGGVLAAVYVSIGAEARRDLTTTDYTAICYLVAAAVLLGTCLAAGTHLAGFHARTWACLVAITVGPQLLGHSILNRVVRTAGPTVVSVALLGEIVGASLLAAWWFGERPPALLVPAAAAIGAGVVLVMRSGAVPAEPAVAD